MDWNFDVSIIAFVNVKSPSLRGSGLKLLIFDIGKPNIFVSLFTREWIEITSNAKTKDGGRRLPLYEGVDWNLWVVKKRLYGAIVSLFTREWIEIIRLTAFFPAVFSLPLYEGVDWNFHKSLWISVQVLVSLFTREWIEIPVSWFAIRSNKSPSLRGSGLKSKNAPVLYNVFWSLPLYEGVDWNSCFLICHQVKQVSLFTREWIEIKKRSCVV